MKIDNKKLINVWKDRNETSVYVLYEDQDGNRKTKKENFDWYFVIDEENYKKANRLRLDHKLELKSGRDSKFPGYVKIYCNPIDSHNIQHARQNVIKLFEDAGIKTYEGDLDIVARWYIDTQMEIARDLKKLYFDIETQDELGKIEIGAERILSFAGVDNEGRRCFYYIKELTDQAEKELLIKILEAITAYDIILGWNSDEFDIPYLKARMRYHKLHDFYEDRDTAKMFQIWYRVSSYDLLKRFRHQFRFDSSLRSFSLDYISNHFLGKGKVEYGKQRIIDLWKTDKKLLKEYNFEDSLLVKELDDKLGVSDMMILQASWCLVPASKFGLYKIIDAYILNMAHKHGKYEPTAMPAINETAKRIQERRQERGYNENTRSIIKINPDETETERQKYHGGLVLDPVPGLYKKVYSLDFKSLYPSIMKTSNVGHETLRYENEDGNCIINPGTQVLERKDGTLRPTFFTQDKSTINRSITELLTKRKEYKAKKLQMIEEGKNHGPEWDLAVSNEIVVKEVANSMYGIMGMVYGRYFDVDIAESITLMGQWIISATKKYFEEQRNYEVIYGDTDSVFLSTPEEIDIEKELEWYHEWLTKTFKEEYNIHEHFIVLEPDKEYDGLILIAKKTYAGHVVNIEGKKTDDTYSRGVEFLKRGTFGYAAEKQKELVEMILRKKPSDRAIKSWLTKTKKDFLQYPFTKDELSISHKVGKRLEDYADEKVSNKTIKKKDKEFRPEMYSCHFDMDDEEIIVRKKQTLPLHVRIAKKIKEETGEFYKNTEVEYIVTSHDKRIDGVHAPDFDGSYDSQYYWNNKTLPLLSRVINVTHPEIDTDKWLIEYGNDK